jgi:hypothetical protein
MQDLLDKSIRRALADVYPELDDERPDWPAVVVDAQAANGGVVRASRPFRARRAVLLAAALLVASLAAIAPGQLLRHGSLGATNAAAQELRGAAVVAASARPSTPGRFAYSKQRTVFGGTSTDAPPFTALVTSIRETWTATDGSGRTHEVPGAPYYLGARDRSRAVASGHLPLKQAATDREFSADANASTVRSLPTDPHTLEAALRAEARVKDPPVTSAMLVRIADLLQSPFASPALRAALYSVLSRLDGVESMGSVRDPVGRSGQAISAPAGYADPNTLRTVLVFDPTTAAVLAVETLLIKPVDWIDAKPPAVIGSVTYLDSGWTDSVRDTPQTS